MNLPSEVGNVDSSVGFTGDEEWVVEELRVARVEVLNCGHSIAGLSHIVVDAILRVHANRETDASRTFNIEHVGPFIPGVRIVLDVELTIVDHEGTVFLEQSKQRRATRAAIEPDDHRVILRIAL